MALATFDDLKESIINWSHREDIDELVEDFIDLAEVEMFSNPEAVLEIKGQETTDNSLTTTSQSIALPTDYQSMRSLRLSLNSAGTEIRFRAPEQLVRQDTTGRPRFFTVVGNNLEFERSPDAAYEVELKYYAKPTPLSDNDPTNDVLTNHPNIYLFGSLWACFEFATDPQEANKWYGRFLNSIKGANFKDKAGRYGPAPAMRIEGSTP